MTETLLVVLLVWGLLYFLTPDAWVAGYYKHWSPRGRVPPSEREQVRRERQLAHAIREADAVAPTCARCGIRITSDASRFCPTTTFEPHIAKRG